MAGSTSYPRYLVVSGVLFLLLGGLSSTLKAATISLIPSSSSIAVGGTVTVDISISGLADSAAPSLSAYDIEMTFDETVLGWTGIVFGDVGGDQLDLGNLGAITAYDDSVPGALFFSEISLDDPGTLDSDQLGAFRLAQLTFTGLSSGISVLDLPSITLLDSLGDPIELDAAVVPLSIEVAAVPIPAAAWIFGSALAILGVIRRRSPSRLEAAY